MSFWNIFLTLIICYTLPLPLIFAMENSDVKERANKIIGKPRLSDQDVAKLVDITLESKPVVSLKERMKDLIDKGLKLTRELPSSATLGNIQILLSFMLEDL